MTIIGADATLHGAAGRWHAATAGCADATIRRGNRTCINYRRFAPGSQGYEVLSSTPEQMAASIRGEIAKWGKIVKASGAKVD